MSKSTDLRSLIRAAHAAGNADFVINARTDALRAAEDRALGIQLAADRANRYVDAGADLAFVCGVATLDEVRQLRKTVRGPLSIAAGLPYDIDAFSVDDLGREGVARVSLPSLAVFAATHGMSVFCAKWLRRAILPDCSPC